MSDDDQPTGVGRFSVLTQDSENSISDTNVGLHTSSGTRVTFEEAQNESGTGAYQIILLCVCGLVNMSCAISTTAVSFMSPAAEQDFNLNSITKGILNGSPFLGMVLGAYFWGICGDINGRRFVILSSMGMDSLCTIISCLTQHVAWFIIVRIGNGFAIIGATCMIYVYFGEFLTPNKRDSYLLFLEIFWALGMIVTPGIAMMIIPNNIVLVSYTYFTFNAWRIFILLTSLPSLISFILIYQYPETPRYLMLRGHMTNSMDVLERIYYMNNKNTTIPYSVESFTQTYSAIGFSSGFNVDMPLMMVVKRRLVALKNGHKALFSLYRKNIMVTCLIEFCLMASYITVLIWIPELFSRYYDYKEQNSDDLNICSASEWLLKNHNRSTQKSVSGNAYFAALIVATTTVPLVIITGIAVKYLNKKIFLFISCGIPIVVSSMVGITKNDLQVEIICCIFEGFTSLMEPILFCIIVELFPSNVRGVAFSLIVMTGRLGAIFGVIVFGMLIDQNCSMIFYLLAVLLSIAFLAASFLPKLKVGGSH